MKCLPAVCVALILAACSMPLPTASVQPPAVRENSWMAPDAGSAPLLYISDWSTNHVFVYNFSTKALVGKLTGLHTPYGQCVDATGNVWIAELDDSVIVQYAHGGTKPTRHLQTSGYPIGCSVNPSNGDLAVANFTSTNGAGNLEVWPGARTPAKHYRASKFYYLWPPAYDGTGNLFAEGQIRNGGYGLTELAKGAGTLQTIALTGATIHYAGGVFWGRAALGVTDRNAEYGNTTVIYRTLVTGTTGKVVGRTHLTDNCYHNYADVIAPFPVREAGGSYQVIGGNLWCARRFGMWSYPAGGNPADSLPKAPAEPFGESVSPPGKAGA